jgi:RsmE family RNA methyltransferase
VNLVLLEPEELREDGTARLLGRRAAHLTDVLRAAAGGRIRAGVIGGRWGEAEVLRIGDGEVVIRPALDRDPPPPAPVALLLALPRPKVLRRVLQAVASMGVKQLVLLGSWRVEKSYWGSPALEADAIRAELVLGLEQGRDTVLPQVRVRRLFKPFVEDELDDVFPEPVRLLADPSGAAPLEALTCPRTSIAPRSGAGEGARPPGPRAALAVGPEGGFTAYEAGALRSRGFASFTLGDRILRVDTAVSFALGQVDLWLRAGAGLPGRRDP